MKRLIQLALLIALPAGAQTAVVNWTSQHQQLNGFGASDESQGGSMTSANQQLFFGLGNGQLGFSILRVGLTTGISGGSQDPGNCASVSPSCAGVYTGDMLAILAVSPTNLIYASPWTPPYNYKTNGSVVCNPGAGVLSTGSIGGVPIYSLYATWITNFVKSLSTQVSPSIPLYAVSIQNEPDICPTYNGATYSASTIDTFIKSYLGPSFASNGITTKILTPETSSYGSSPAGSNVTNYGGTCVGDSGCAPFLGGYQWHDYDASLSGGVPPVNPDPVPAGWTTSGKLWWETEASQGNDYGPACGSYSAFTATIADGLCWGAIIDQRMQDGANAWLYWQFMDYGGSAPATIQNGALMSNAAAGSVVAKRAYVLGQYAHFVRPGDYRIDATHSPRSGVTVSAFQNTGTNTIKIILSNYTGSAIAQAVTISNAPTFTTLTPTQTSASNSLATLSAISVASNSFTFTMPAQSVTTLVGTASSAPGPLWAGLLNTNRAPPGNPWSSAGAGAIPARTTICQTLGTAGQSPSFVQSVTAGQIFSALQACANTNQTVYLNAGTYNLTAPISPSGTNVPWPSNVTLRGAGPQQTKLVWQSGTTFSGCNGNSTGLGNTLVCITNGDSGLLQFSANILTVTSGMTQGSTTVTLGAAPTGSLCPNTCSGSVSNLRVGSLIAFNQLDDSSDNGNWFVCGTGGTTGTCSQQGVANAWNYNGVVRAEMQTVTVTAISGSTVTFTPALYAPNWTSGKSPYATFSSDAPVTGAGIENLQINTQQVGDIQAMTEFNWATNSWAKNVAFVNNVGIGAAARKHIEASGDAHLTIQDSYFYGSQPSSEAYGVDLIWGTSDSLVQNNIFHHIASATMTETAVGNVFGYNFAADNFYTGSGSAPNWQQCDAFHHDDGDYYNLWEGHEGICWSADDIHGTSGFDTGFRDYFNGRDPANQCPGGGTACGTGAKTQNTEAIQKLAYARYDNVVASVLGTSGYHNTYQNAGASGNPNSCPSFNSTAVYSLNFAVPTQQPISPTCNGANWTLDNDSLVTSSMMRWGNYDVVNGSVQTNSGETASGASTYPGLASPSTAWSSYPSLYLTSKPSFMGSLAWPGIGPEVTGGNISGVSGHANHNAAGNCFYNILGGVNSGASGPLPFDANNCYTAGPPTANAPTFSPATPYSGAATTVTASTSTSACSSYIYFGTANPPTVNTSTYSFTATVTLYAYVHGCPGYADSPVETWSGTLATPGLAAPTFSPVGSVDTVTAPYFLSNPTITITGTGTFCYRTDGTAPTAPTAGTCGAGSTTYSGPFTPTISTAGLVLKALATLSGSTNSSVTTEIYIQRAAILESTCPFNSGNTVITTATCTPSPTPSAGDGVSLGYAIGNGTATATFTDNLGGTYAVANTYCYGNTYGANTYAASGRVYRTTPWPGGAGVITMTLTGASQYTGFGAEFWKPATAGNFLVDTTFTSAYTQPCVTGTTANPVAASHTPTNANEIVYGQVLTYVQVPAAGSGFTLVNPLPGGPNIYPEYQIQSTATATTLPYTMSADQWQLQPAAFYFLPPVGVPSNVQGVVIQGVTVQ